MTNNRIESSAKENSCRALRMLEVRNNKYRPMTFLPESLLNLILPFEKLLDIFFLRVMKVIGLLTQI